MNALFCFGYPEFFPDILSVPDHGGWGLLQEGADPFCISSLFEQFSDAYWQKETNLSD